MDALIDPSFKTQSDGKVAFYPRGVRGRGYVLPDTAVELRLRKKIKASYLILFPVMVVTFPIIGRLGLGALTTVCFVFIAAFSGWYHFAVERTVRMLPVATTTLTTPEIITVQAARLNWAWVMFLLVTNLCFVALGVWILAVDPEKWPVAALSIVFFGFGLFATVKLCGRKLRGNGRTPNSP